MDKKYTMHVISGTHWDREWRHTAEQSKLRLADLMDNILHILENDPEYKCFCVDGGMIVIEDYLSIRPENKQRIQNLITSKKMLVVNWYTLPETNTVAPEALIRNLLVGHRMAKEFGGGMKSGYTATSYGQHSQMPQLYQGFGIETAIFYRGTNKHVLTPLFKWVGLDGSQLFTLRTFDEVTRTNWFFYVHGPVVLGKGTKDLGYTYDRENDPVHLCDQGLYEKAFVLLREDHGFNHDRQVMKKALDSIVDQAKPYAVGDNLLALNMEDNDEPYKLLPDMIKEMNGISGDVEIIQNSLDEYMDRIIRDSDEKALAVHKGELRYTTMEYNNFNALLGATHSSRIKLKIYNEKAETNLIALAEPLASFAACFGKEYPKTNLNRAWEALLKNHAHDSICGAAVDLAHEDMLYNFSTANTVAEEVAGRSIIALYRNINTAKDFKHTDHTLTLFNTLPYEREEVVPLVIDLPKGGRGLKVDIGVDGASSGEEFYDIMDKEGNLVPYTELSCEDIRIGVERELDTKAIKFPAKRRRLLIEAKVPGMGYTTYALRLREPNLVYHPEIGPDRKLIARDNGVLENENLKVVIHANGTFSLLNKETGRWMENLHYFTDSGETGSAHISVKPQRNPVVTSHGCSAAITLVESNLHRGVYRVDLSFKVPAAATLDGRDRLRQMVEIPVSCRITLEKGGKAVKIRTRIHNEARDHKLCVNFPSGIQADYAASESAWAVEKRTIRWTENGDDFEQFYPFQPMQNFVDVSDGKEGLAILNKGLREYEVQDDPERTIAITLIRTQRAYMTANPDMIPEELDKYTGQHSLGDLEYNYAVYPHTGDWEEGSVLKAAYGFKVDLKAIQGVTLDGVLPSTGSFLAVTPEDKVMVSAVKLSEDGSGIVVRLWNTTSETLNLRVAAILPVMGVKRLRLDETIIGELDYNGKFEMEMGPHKIETFLLVL
jgi:mannosylglycerate hydrolase